MGIFNRDDKETKSRVGGITTIALGTEIMGTIKSEDQLQIDGKFKGDLFSSNIIIIGKEGIIDGNVTAAKIVVGGELTGNIETEELQILSSGLVSGEITYSSVSIEMGGMLEGNTKSKTAQSQLKIVASAKDTKKNQKQLSEGKAEAAALAL